MTIYLTLKDQQWHTGVPQYPLIQYSWFQLTTDTNDTLRYLLKRWGILYLDLVVANVVVNVKMFPLSWKSQPQYAQFQVYTGGSGTEPKQILVMPAFSLFFWVIGKHCCISLANYLVPGCFWSFPGASPFTKEVSNLIKDTELPNKDRQNIEFCGFTVSP